LIRVLHGRRIRQADSTGAAASRRDTHAIEATGPPKGAAIGGP
jgi:hypothetical protein